VEQKKHGCMDILVIASCYYEVKAYSPYVTSLVNSINVLHELQLPFDYYELSGDSYVDRAKNALVHRFLKSDASHMLMIDSDEAWDVEGFCRILKAAMMGAEVVGAAYPCKNNWEFFGCIPNKSEDGSFLGKEIGETRLLDMWGIPGGFIMYSRKAFERTRPNLDTYTEPTTGEEILEAFKCNIEPHKIKTKEELEAMDKEELAELAYKMQKGLRGSGGRIGEDIYFQKRYKEMGGIVWLEPNVTIQHYGIKAWEGNYHDFLLRCKAESEIEKAVGSTEAETAAMLAALGKGGQCASL